MPQASLLQSPHLLAGTDIGHTIELQLLQAFPGRQMAVPPHLTAAVHNYTWFWACRGCAGWGLLKASRHSRKYPAPATGRHAHRSVTCP